MSKNLINIAMSHVEAYWLLDEVDWLINRWREAQAYNDDGTEPTEYPVIYIGDANHCEGMVNFLLSLKKRIQNNDLQ